MRPLLLWVGAQRASAVVQRGRPGSLLGHWHGFRLCREYQDLKGQQQQTLVARLGEPIRLGVRLLQLTGWLLPPLVVIAGTGGAHGQDLLNWGLVQAGPCWIKLGQWLACRVDLLPWAWCQSLARLHCRVPPHDLAWTERVLGEEGLRCFDWFDPVPLGSGSMGQVHRAGWRGMIVAVKILHRGVEEAMTVDIQLLKALACLLDPLAGWLALPREVEHFTQLLRRQADLRWEAYCAARLERNLHWQSHRVRVPHVYLATKRVLIEELVEGGRGVGEVITDPDYPPRLKARLARVGLRTVMQMLLWDNFVHADLHPGNLIVKEEGADPILYLIDPAIVTELNRKDYWNLVDLFTALVVKADGYEAARLIIERSPAPVCEIIDPEGFATQLHALIHPLFGGNLSLSKLAIGPTLLATLRLCREHRVKLDGSFSTLVMSLVAVEGVGRQLAPELDLLPILGEAALQYLAVRVGKLLNPLL